MRNARQQPKRAGTIRYPAYPWLLPETYRELERIADHYNVTVSWVMSTILSDACSVKKQISFLEADERWKKKKKKNHSR